MNKKILLMLIVASLGIIIQMILSSLYPASDLSLAAGIALAVFGIVIAIQIALYSKAKKEKI